MGNSGQVCIAAKRFIITDPVYDEFRDRLLEKIQTSTVIGDPMDEKVNLGPLALKRQKELYLDQVKRAMGEGGAKLTYGDLKYKMEDEELMNGNFVSPVLLEGMDTDSKIYGEEIFGPAFSLFKVDTSKEALDLANKSDFGLSSTIFTEDHAKVEAAARRLRTGVVFVNDCVTSGSDFPGGGIKGSGYGRECYKDGLLDIANRKTIISRKNAQ